MLNKHSSIIVATTLICFVSFCDAYSAHAEINRAPAVLDLPLDEPSRVIWQDELEEDPETIVVKDSAFDPTIDPENQDEYTLDEADLSEIDAIEPFAETENAYR